MPQETNLNVAPYFDDFNPQDNYYKVLFKPGYPVQARELNNLQSILQNQIEDVGNHFFKEGAKVIPGDLTYIDQFYAIQIDPEFLGVPVSIYLDQLVGQQISGQTSGITARVVTYITNQQSERDTYTLYIDYFNSSNTDAATEEFFDDEVLVTSVPITFASTFIAAGEGFAKTLSQNAAAVGSAFALNEGIYFLRGYFVQVEPQILILDQYGIYPSYRVGFTVNEQLISSDIDPTLTDNAQGYNNFTAPGADRLKITATLTKKDADDFDDQNFVQLAEVILGALRGINSRTSYNQLGDELAKRTFDESGHYYVKEFVTTARESLNDQKGNRGLYSSDQITQGGNTPTDDLLVYKISPGKAYIKGYYVDILNTSLIDANKPRTTQESPVEAVNFGFGPTFTVNNVHGSPTLGFNTTNTLSLRDQRVGANFDEEPGKEIGLARIYDFSLESGSYDSTVPTINQWDLSLFDVQTYTEFTVNESVTLTTPTFIKGQQSGASAYLRFGATGTGFTAYDVQGEFFIGERLTFNGEETNARTTTSVLNKEISDVQSVFGSVGVTTFTGDLIQSPKTSIGIASISAGGGGVSTVSSPSVVWPGICTVGNLVRYSNPVNTLPSLGRITSVSASQIEIAAVENVSGVNVGTLPTSNLSVTDFDIVETRIQKSASSGNEANNESLYSKFPKSNIQSVDLTNANLTIRKQFDVTITNNSTNTITADPNEVFLPFDEERYTLLRSDGNTEVLTQDKFVFLGGATQLRIDGLGTNDADSKLITTLRKSKVTSKIKQKQVVNTVIIDKSSKSASGVGATTLNDGLTFGNFPFGTRVQDSNLSLNNPDAIKIWGVFESEDTNNPVAPSFVTGSLDGPTATTNDLLIGEEVIGTVSGAVGRYLVRKSDTSINFSYSNNTTFQNGEVVNFTSSGVSAIVANLDSGSKNITDNFTLSSGQRDTIYDYSRLIRKSNADTPSKKLIVYFEKAVYDSADTGDITTVESYGDFNYGTEIQSVNGIRNTDIIDARPRVSEYSVAADSRSPFEFLGRTFDGGQHSSAQILASDESVSLGYNYYLPRADRIYINKDKTITVKYGTPSENPKLPEEVNGALNIANVYLPAYLYDVKDARVTFVSHKRYQMSDISKLEQRIKNLEYYTSLNQLEVNTLNLFIPDENGLNKFKSGIFVDNFSSLDTQDVNVGVRNSIDVKNRVLRPSHYTTALNMTVGNTTMAGIGTTTAPNQDTRFADVQGDNVQRHGQVITLDYDELFWSGNQFATRVENVTPYLLAFYDGTIELEPTVDVWVQTNRLEPRDFLQEGNFQSIALAMGVETFDEVDGQRVGISPVIWDSWETVGVNLDVDLESRATSNTVQAGRVITTTNERFLDSDISVDLQQQRTGTQTIITEQIDTSSLGDRVVNREIINFMRSRNIEFTNTRMKPFTQLYSFFDGVDVNSFCFPKLVEIEMISGTFQVSEDVEGTMPATESSVIESAASVADIAFRVSQLNHKYGPYNDPTDFFVDNPYDRNNVVPSTYSDTSTLINVDTFSMAQEENQQYGGYIATGMILRGQSSGAQARVTNVRLITDNVGTLIGSYRVPDTDNLSNPTFETGNNTFRLTSSPTNSQVFGTFNTAAQEIFYSQGDLENMQEVTLSLRNARVDRVQEFTEQRTVGDSVEQSTLLERTVNVRVLPPPPPPPAPARPRAPAPPPRRRRRDPLAQTFFVDEDGGIYITSIDIYFNQKDDNVPVTLQVREVDLGTPTLTILPYSEVNVDPAAITTSDDGSVATNIKFQAPVYLAGDREYAIVLLSHSTQYQVWISRLGEVEISSSDTESGAIVVTEQPLLGSLFKSQNASVWTPSQYEDLKFNLYRAEFVNQGTVSFYNPSLPESIGGISRNGITMTPNNIRIGIGTTVQDTTLEFGNTVTQNGTTASGTLVGYAGSATGTMTVTNPGVGYTPAAGTFQYTGVALTSVTGSGLNALADIMITNGVAIAATINTGDGGKGYAIGDVLTPIQVGNLTLGSGMRLSVGDIAGQNELILTDVQGTFSTSSPNFLTYTTSAGLAGSVFNDSVGGNVIPESPIRTTDDGLHMTVFQRTHGMYSNTNLVTLSGISGDVAPTTLTVDYSNTATGEISVASTTNFGTFENVSVATTNPGYVKVGNEIISYTGVAAGTLTGITRGVDNTLTSSHFGFDLVSKYELNGVSLRRINKTHNLNEVTNTNTITNDTYQIKIDMNESGTDRRPGSTFQRALHFNSQATGGGPFAKGSYNIPFDLVIPQIRVSTPAGVSINSQVRTITGSSLNGTESSFVDQGFEQMTLNQENYFDSTRMVASDINESTYLDSLPGNKSLAVGINMFTGDRRLSPCIDLNHASMVFVNNRINQPVTNFETDFRVNTVTDDPNRFFYITKNIRLENPATSVQVLLDSYVSTYNDVRVFYSVDGSDVVDENTFVAFPGYDNLDPAGNPISAAGNSGRPDTKIGKVDQFTQEPRMEQFREYKFTANNLNPFSAFRIKIIGTSTNSAVVPQFRNLRVIALA